MEREREYSEEDERVSSSTITINGDHAPQNNNINIGHVSEKEEEEEEDEEDIATLGILKKEITCHSLYGLLVQSHLGCLKLCLGDINESVDTVIDPTAASNHPDLFMADQTELDQFMEAYCVTLKKLKEVIEKPQQESMSFINHMYSQLQELEEIDQKAELK